MMKIYTNNHDRHLKYKDEVPQDIIDDYDWLDEDEAFDGWIHYRDRWYHTSDFMRFGYGGGTVPDEFDGWHGYLNDSFFSGVIIKLSDCGESYNIGTFIS